MSPSHAPPSMAETQPPRAPDRATSFTAVYDRCAPRVYAYARRHCATGDAHDVVSETFLVAWRRFDEIPADAVPWLLVVARNVIRNLVRGDLRRRRLVEAAEGAARLATPASAAEEHVLERDHVVAALDQLTGTEREAVLLVAWDGLSNTEAATVAGCSTRAFEVRLSRARARLARCLNDCTDMPRPSARPVPRASDTRAKDKT